MAHLRRCFEQRTLRVFLALTRELCLQLELLLTPSRDGGAREAEGQ